MRCPKCGTHGESGTCHKCGWTSDIAPIIISRCTMADCNRETIKPDTAGRCERCHADWERARKAKEQKKWRQRTGN